MSKRRSDELPGGSMISPSILWILGVGLLALTVYVARDLLLLLVLSTALAYLMNPIVRIVEGALIRREIAVTAVYLGIGSSLLVTTYFLFPRLSAEMDALSVNLPSFAGRLDEAVDVIQNEIVQRYPAARRFFTVREVRADRLGAFIEWQTADLPGLLSHLALAVMGGVLIPFFSFFLLRDSRKIILFVLDRLPAAHIETSVAVWCEIDQIVGRYLRGLAVDATVVGVFAAIGLWMLGVNYPLLLGALSGLANVAPYFGPIIGGAAAMLVAMVQFKSLGPVAQVFALYLSIKLLDVVVVQPIAIGRGQHLHPVLLIVSILVGGHVLGIVGMVIAVPMVTILQEIAKLLLERRRYALPMADSRRNTGVPIQPYVC
jgi:predicted PurR-regulated permease PerM